MDVRTRRHADLLPRMTHRRLDRRRTRSPHRSLTRPPTAMSNRRPSLPASFPDPAPGSATGMTLPHPQRRRPARARAPAPLAHGRRVPARPAGDGVGDRAHQHQLGHERCDERLGQDGQRPDPLPRRRRVRRRHAHGEAHPQLKAAAVARRAHRLPRGVAAAGGARGGQVRPGRGAEFHATVIGGLTAVRGGSSRRD